MYKISAEVEIKRSQPLFPINASDAGIRGWLRYIRLSLWLVNFHLLKEKKAVK
jgi:hypothetical protein